MKANAFDFAAWVDREIDALSQSEYLRRVPHAKRLIEEWYPLSRLALHLKRPGRNIQVEGFGDDRVAYGHITASGDWEASFNVQVTVVADYEGALRRELLMTQGFTPGAGPISRNKRTDRIEATMGGLDRESHHLELADDIAERFTRKNSMDSYPPDTVLLIAVDEAIVGGPRMWSEMQSHLQRQVPLHESRFMAVFVFNSAMNELVRMA